MGWRFRKSVKILPGIKLNFGKKGLNSVTVGGKYAKTNISKKGTYNTYSLPGTGLSYRTKVSGGSSNNSQQSIQTGYVKPISEVYWQCSQCSMINFPTSEICDGCKIIKPKALQQSEATRWYCNHCYSGNFSDNSNCQQCGHARYTAQNGLSPNSPGRNLLIVIGAIFVPIALCVGLASLGKSSRLATNSSQSTSSQSSATPVNFTPTPAATIQAKSVTKNKETSVKTASIISENANLRESADQSANVITTVAQDEDVEIIKQKGAWFYVKSTQGKGWLHGNTIRLSDIESKPTSAVTETPSTTESYSTYSSSSGYYKGPRGGCYTYSSSGRKRYVDHSYCR